MLGQQISVKPKRITNIQEGLPKGTKEWLEDFKKTRFNGINYNFLEMFFFGEQWVYFFFSDSITIVSRSITTSFWTEIIVYIFTKTRRRQLGVVKKSLPLLSSFPQWCVWVWEVFIFLWTGSHNVSIFYLLDRSSTPLEKKYYV